MIRVFLVEDEYIIREAIKRTVDWNAAGYEFAGEAGDGEKAYPMILERKPDIVITDIRMPFMDGLELSRLVRQHLPSAKIVILSGYDDFAYAKEAISIGVTEYLLKPVSGAKLLETLKKVSEGIEADRRQRSFREIYEAEHAEKLRLEKQNFVRSVIDGKLTMAEALEKAEKLGVRISAAYYSVMLLQFSPRETESAAREENDDSLKALSALTAVTEKKENTGIYEQIGGILCVLVMSDSEEGLKESISEEIRTAGGISSEYPSLMLSIAVGEPADRIRGIHHSYHDASRRFSRRFVSDGSCIFSYEDDAAQERKEPVKEDGTIHLGSFDIGKIDRRMVFSFLRSGNQNEVEAFVSDIASGIGARNMNSQILRHYIIMDTYLAAASYLTSAGISNEEIESSIGVLMDPSGIGSFRETTDYLENMFRAAITERDRHSENRYGTMIADAKTYIYRNFDRNDISLTTVADAVGVSPNHLSRIFSQKTGGTFIEFLTDVRMEKAKDLLLSTEFPSSEIGQKVGYSDPHYFYYLFKKTQNQTPKEFRARTKRAEVKPESSPE